MGTSGTPDSGVFEAFLFEAGVTVPLGTLGGLTSFAGTITEGGDIVGEASLPTGESHAVKFVVGGTPIDLAPTWYSSAAASVNSRGDIVGHVKASVDSSPQAELFGVGRTPMLLKDLVPFDSAWEKLLWATDVNENGEIVGVGVIAGEPGIQAFIMRPVPEPITSTCLGICMAAHMLFRKAICCNARIAAADATVPGEY